MLFQRQGDGFLHWIVLFCAHLSQVVIADNFGSWTLNGIRINSMSIHNAAISINEQGWTIRNKHNAAVTVSVQGVTLSNINNVAITVNDDGITISSKTGSPKDEKEQEKPEDPAPEEAEKENSALHDKTPEEATEENSVLTVEELGGDKEDNNGADKVKIEAEEEKTNAVAQEEKGDADEETLALCKGEEKDEEEVRTVYKNFGTIHYEIRNNMGDLLIGKYTNYGLIHVNLHDNEGNIDIKIRNKDDKARVFIHCHRNRGIINIVKDPKGTTELQTNNNNMGRIVEIKPEADDDPKFEGTNVVQEFYGARTISIDNK